MTAPTLLSTAPDDDGRGHPLDIAQLVGAAGWQRLSPAIRRRFAAAHIDVAYTGTMRLRSSWTGRCFAVVTGCLGGPLPSAQADEVPAQVRVHGNHRGGVVWERRLSLRRDAPPRNVRSTKQRSPGGGLEECTDGGLSMTLDVQEVDGALVFSSRAYFFTGRLGGWQWRLPIPMWLTPGVCRVEHRDEGPGRFRFTLTMTHPWWGETFHQTGVFADPEQGAV